MRVFIGLLFCYTVFLDGTKVHAQGRFTLGTPERLGLSGATAGSRDMSPSISNDGLTVYFHSNRTGGGGDNDDNLWVATRARIGDPWGTPVKLANTINTSGVADAWPDISAGGNALYYTTDRNFMVATRISATDPWQAPGTLDGDFPLGASPNISDDGLSLYFSSGADLWVTSRSGAADRWGVPINMGLAINTEFADVHPSVTGGGQQLFFNSNRSGIWDIWVTSRRSTSAAFGEPLNLRRELPDEFTAVLNPDISSDGSTLYFASRGTSLDNPLELWQVPIEFTPAVIFDDGNQHAVNYDLSDNFINVFDGPGSSVTTVEITHGAYVGMDNRKNSLEVFNNSLGEIRGGFIEGDVEAHDNATVYVRGGLVQGFVQTERGGSVHVIDGVIQRGVQAGTNGEIRISGGDVEDDALAYGNGRLYIAGGVMGDDVFSAEDSSVEISGGLVEDDVAAWDNGHIVVLGGTLREDIVAEDNARVIVAGGIIGPDDAPDERLEAYDNGVITLIGSEFQVDGTSVGFGPLIKNSGLLSGVLSDGTSFDMAFLQEFPAQIVLSDAAVPEPNALALVMCAFFIAGAPGIWRCLQNAHPSGTSSVTL